MKSLVCARAKFSDPQRCLEPPISHQKRNFVYNFDVFHSSYNIRSEYFLWALTKNSKTNCVSMKSLACIHAKFLNPQRCLEPPISHQKRNFVYNFDIFHSSYNIRSECFYGLLRKIRRQNCVSMKSLACIHAKILNPQRCLEPPISHQKRNFVYNFDVFHSSYNVRSESFYGLSRKIRRQNCVPLKSPACVHVVFLNPQRCLEPPISHQGRKVF